MNSFELNKIAGAVLFCLLIIMGVNQVGNMLIHPKKLAEAAFKIDVPEEAPAGGAPAAVQEQDPPVATVLASANADAGKKAFGKCASCHSVEKGGPAKVGPNLFDIVQAPKGHMAGFAYSDGLKKTGGEWTYDSLYAFLKNPKAYAPGTKMAFAGAKSAKERGDLIAYLRSLSDSPKPLPN
ncbi:cytochrome c family protein [Ferrovibrio terrae]|uniref:Cytochrome c family protein n=1 Tax=Ferrovibrio terrae TaxID=2594003 RepID=A0A516GXD1_9PROT|nr:cytochrome c family protein [Ferrovibrio terrae]QDO96152.1 cytochrome c family protein [Ferrovibrio terrae]